MSHSFNVNVLRLGPLSDCGVTPRTSARTRFVPQWNQDFGFNRPASTRGQRDASVNIRLRTWMIKYDKYMYSTLVCMYHDSIRVEGCLTQNDTTYCLSFITDLSESFNYNHTAPSHRLSDSVATPGPGGILFLRLVCSPVRRIFRAGLPFTSTFRPWGRCSARIRHKAF